MKRDSESSYVHMKRDTIRQKYRGGGGGWMTGGGRHFEPWL